MTESVIEHIARDMKEGRFPKRSAPRENPVIPRTPFRKLTNQDGNPVYVNPAHVTAITMGPGGRTEVILTTVAIRPIPVQESLEAALAALNG